MLSQKRRKKRAQHGVKTIELNRSKHGYGFTISGQQPCVLGNIITGSPADDQGLKDGDHLISVNNFAVAQLSHEQVVRIIGSSSSILRLQIAENRNSSDSSDEEYVKPRYTHRNRAKSSSKGVGHVTPSIENSSRKPRKDAASPFPGQVSGQHNMPLSLAPRFDQNRHDPFPTVYNPTRAINGRASDFGVVRQTHIQERRVGDYYRQGSSGLPAPGLMVRSTSEPDVSAAVGTQESITPHDLSHILYPAMQPAVISSSSTLNNEDDQPSLRVIVGYIGSIEMPQDSNLPSSRLQSIRSAVRRLRIEKKVHTLILLEIRADGIKLINALGSTIVHYPVKRLAMSGMYPDDKRFFGLVTIQEKDEDDDEEALPSSSCHVFMVEPELGAHNVHAQKAKNFGIHCTIDPNTHRCIEFPKSCTPILRTAARLYRNRHGGIFEVPRQYNGHRASGSDIDSGSDSGLGFHKDQDEHHTADRVYVVDVHIPDIAENSPTPSGERVASPAGASGLQRSQTPIKSSPVSDRSGPTLGHGQPQVKAIPRGGPPPYIPPPDIHGLHRSQPPPPAFQTAKSPMKAVSQNPMTTVRAKSIMIGSPRGNVLDIRASSPKLDTSRKLSLRSHAAVMSPAAVTGSPLDPGTVEQLRKNMQRLLQKRKENIQDTHSLSDTESIISDVINRESSFAHFSVHSDSSTSAQRFGKGAVAGLSTSSESLETSRHSQLAYQMSTPLYCERVYTPAQRPSREFMDPRLSRGPPVPPKPNLTAQRAIYEQNSVSRQSKVQTTQPRTSDGTAGDNIAEPRQARPLEQMRRQMKMTSAKTASLDSKLSPRAYPVTTPKPTKVVVSGKSAFQRFSPEGPELHYYEQQRRAFAVNNNNNGSHHNNHSATLQTHVTRTTTAERPIPAPRLRPVIVEAPFARSASVPPEPTTSWQRIGREVNVDDGMSIHSESVMSLETAGQNDNSARGDKHKRPLSVSSQDDRQSTSIRSLLEVTGESKPGSQSTLDSTAKITNNNVGRVACWAVSFENLLQDEKGLEAFTEFLTKEYSQENIKFWLACEEYRQCKIALHRKESANTIFATYLSSQAGQPVNIDSQAMKTAEEQLANPSANIFDEAQQQVFTLMKTDSYTRFIKSEFYQTLLMREFGGDAVTSADAKEKLKSSFSDASDTSDNQKKRTMAALFKDFSKTLTKSGENSKRLTLDGTAKKQWSRSSEDSSLERSRSKRGGRSSRRLDGSIRASLSDMKRQMESGGSQDERSSRSESEDGDSRLLLRVLLPDGATSVIQAHSGDTLRMVLDDLLSRKSKLKIFSIDVFLLNSDKVLNLDQFVADLSSQEIRVERRVVFRISLPNRQAFGMKAKPQRTIRDVLRPLLNKYRFSIDDMVVLLDGEIVRMDTLVEAIEGCKLTVQPKADHAGGHKPKREWGFHLKKHQIRDMDGENWNDVVDFENSHDLKKARGTGFFGKLKNNSLEERGTLKKPKGKVTFGPAKSLDEEMLDGNSRKAPKNIQFLDMLTRAQNSRFDDQRGVGVDVGDLPDFLKSSSNDGAVKPLNSEDKRASKLEHCDKSDIERFDIANESAQFSDIASTGSSDNASGTLFYVGHDLVSHGDDNYIPTNEEIEELTRSEQLANQHTILSDTPSKHNVSYRSAVGLLGEDDSEELNATIVANTTLERTIVPNSEPQSPLQKTYPPPPQFGNEATTSTPQEPPSYTEALNRSALAASFNVTSINGTPHRPANISTIPGTRLSFAQQPMIINDEITSNHPDDRSTPSPTTHSLVLTIDEQGNNSSQNTAAEQQYSFYENKFKTQVSSQQEHASTSNDAMKITFV